MSRRRCSFAFLLLTFLIPGLIANLFAQQMSNQRIIKNNNSYYLANTVVVKYKPGTLNKTSGNPGLPPSALKLASALGVSSIKQTFKARERGGLDNIVTIEYSSPEDPVAAAKKLSMSEDILWAEPHYVNRVDYTPNDPSYSSQWALSKIKAEQAWDISKGDTSIVIGIVDTGVDWDHPDLARNIWINRKEIPNNNIDDDQNGYVDDVRGWDFGGMSGTPDNNPMEDQPDHGTHVAGIASGVTDNQQGIASIGYNCRLMAIKTARNDNRDENGNAYISYGYEGIVYAIDNGARVINCSWGNESFSRAAQEVVQYALAHNALIVAAAGNSGASALHFPSGYDGVLSVASTGQADKKSTFSNYGTTIDVSAPGESIYSTWQNNTYISIGGTSMASPLASGLVALVMSRFPSYTAAQAGEQVRVNADNIDGLNTAFTNRLGKGRINAFNALNNTDSKSVRAYDIVFSDEQPGGNGNGVLEKGETISVGLKLRNYLSSTSNLTVTLESRDNMATVVNSTFNAGVIATLDSTNNFASKFTFNISGSIPENREVSFLLKFSDGSYNDYQWTTVLVNPTYFTQSSGKVSLTITSRGTLGFNDYPDDKQGTGFKYRDESNLLFEGGLLYGVSSAKVMDGVRDQDQQSTDFQAVQPFIIKSPGTFADQEGITVFNDNGAGSSKVGIETRLESYSYRSEPDDKYIILRYKMKNTSGADISNFYAGLFFDWDIVEGSGIGDYADYDKDFNLGYAYNSLGSISTYVGCSLISDEKYNFYAIDNSGRDGGVGIYSSTSDNGFTDAEKWTTLSTGLNKIKASNTDISFVLSGGPYVIKAGDTLDIAFAVAAGDDQADLRKTFARSRERYHRILTGVERDGEVKPATFSLEQNYPNPFNPSTSISYSIPEDGMVTLNVFNLLGQKVATLVNTYQQKGSYRALFNASGSSYLTSGVYLYRLDHSGRSITKKMMFVK